MFKPQVVGGVFVVLATICCFFGGRTFHIMISLFPKLLIGPVNMARNHLSAIFKMFIVGAVVLSPIDYFSKSREVHVLQVVFFVIILVFIVHVIAIFKMAVNSVVKNPVVCEMVRYSMSTQIVTELVVFFFNSSIFWGGIRN
jgi:hypothetical protein